MRDIFKLKPEEVIYDDFGCTEGSFSSSGRMYLSQGYLCFYRSTFGFQTKLKIPWLEILEISNKDTSKILIRYNKIEDGKSEKEELVFSGFTSRDTTSKYLIKLWQRAKGVDSDTESATSSTDENKKKAPQAEKTAV